MVTDIPVAASLSFQILLTINVYISIFWGLIYGFYMIINLSKLGSTNGVFIVVSYLGACFGECCRLYNGYSGNLRSNTRDLNTFYVISPFIQLPILSFLLLFFFISNILLTVTTIILLLFIILEMIVGLFACHQITKTQSEIFRRGLSGFKLKTKSNT